MLLAAGVGLLLARRRRAVATGHLSAAVLAAVVLTSCSTGDTKSAYLPPPVPIVTVNMSEYRFDVSSSGTLPAGRVVFRLAAVGEEAHTPFLVALDDGASPIAQYLLETDRPTIKGFANVSQVAPGAIGTFAVDLEPGRRYALVCNFRAPDGHIHAELGETWEARALSE
jgi:uncharacterized cupredoxin-like copper-binding protein